MLLKFALNAVMLEVRVMSNRSLTRRTSAPEARPGLHGRPVALGPPAAPEPAWLSISQLCSRWQLGRKTVYKFIDSRILPAWKVGPHLYRVSVRHMLQFEAQNAFGPILSETEKPASKPRRHAG